MWRISYTLQFIQPISETEWKTAGGGLQRAAASEESEINKNSTAVM